MKMKSVWFAAIVLAGVVLAGSVYAYGWRGSSTGMGNHHEEMEDLMEEGKYSDLRELREKFGFNMMPGVDNEESFKEMQEMHEAMEEFHEERGFENGMGEMDRMNMADGMHGMSGGSGMMGRARMDKESGGMGCH